jgi:hypothetical protein
MMEALYKAKLPPNITALVDRIESFARHEISVAVDTRPVSPRSPNPDRLAARVTEREATILLRSSDVFPPHDVLHELLHIERLWLEGIPQVLPLHDPELGTVTSAIENALEHLVIVPREADYGFDPYPYWNETSRRNWQAYPWPTISDASTRRRNCLLFWLTASQLVNDDGVKALAERSLTDEGLLDEARRFSARIVEKLASKPQAISAALRFLKIPPADVHIVKFDIQNERWEPVPIPPH